uniref:SEC7 domain-containing protein n=1 Tax=Angiostrongylus cantonensis TaxID=6313 RepID=A0A0K0D0V7_ANGCA
MQNGFSKYLRCHAESAFGFPEQDVIHFINNNGLSKEEARDFMLFLTFVNQTEDTDGDNMGVILNATVLAVLVTRLNKSATEDEDLPDTIRPKILYSSHSVDKPSISLSDTIPSLPHINSIGFRQTSAKHNDAKYYPNIICLICKEWVCSRSRVFVCFRGVDSSRLSMAVRLRVGGLRSCIKLNLLQWNTAPIK